MNAHCKRVGKSDVRYTVYPTEKTGVSEHACKQ